MVTGISVFSDSTTIQIDDRYATYGLIEKIVTRNTSLSQLILTALRPVVNNAPIDIGKVDNGYDVELYKFGLPSEVTDNFGLEVRNANGNVVYHSSYKPIRVIDFIRKPTKKSDGSINLDITTLNYSVSKIGVIISNWSQIFKPGDSMTPMLIIKPRITINNGTVVLGHWTTTLNQPSQFDYVVDSFNDFIIVDLTNY